MAQLVERHLAKVEVAGSTPVARSSRTAGQGLLQCPSKSGRVINFGRLAANVQQDSGERREVGRFKPFGDPSIELGSK